MASAHRASQFRTPRIHVSYRAPEMAWLLEDFTHPERSPPGSDAVASWWVIDEAAETAGLERALDDFVPRWLKDTWQFTSVYFLL